MTQCMRGGRRITCGSAFSPSPRSQNQVIKLGDEHPYLSHLGGFRPWFWILEQPLSFRYTLFTGGFANSGTSLQWQYENTLCKVSIKHSQDSKRLLKRVTSKAKNDLEFLPPPPRAETTGVYHVYSFRGTRAPSQGFIYAMQVLSQLNCIPDPICSFSIMEGIYNSVRHQYIL